MFVGWLAETYGEPALWRLIGEQATSATIVLGVDGRFDEVYGKGMDELVAEFRRHVARRYPVRSRPGRSGGAPPPRCRRALGDRARRHHPRSSITTSIARPRWWCVGPTARCAIA
jgi:hypothetical protein